MPRLFPLTDEQKRFCRELKALRLQMRMPITELAQVVGMKFATLQSRELVSTPWQPGEITRVKQAVHDHLAAGFAALEAFKS